MAPPSSSPSTAGSSRTRVRRVPENARYDAGTIAAILDAAMVCHVAFVDGDQPLSIPTLHARVGDDVLIHGSSGSRAMRLLATGVPAGLTVTLLDGVVLARSVFEHSVAYRSAMLFGRFDAVTEPAAKTAALRAFTEKLLPGRWDEARQPSPKEDAATLVLRMTVDEASAKVDDGPPEDDEADLALDVWAGTVPLTTRWGAPVPDPRLRPGIEVSPSVGRLVEES